MSILRGGGKELDRVIMWKMRSAAGDHFFGALEDGTVFEQSPSAGWATLVGGPADLDASYERLLKATARVERAGGVMVAGPCEFGLDRRVTEDIRMDTNWRGNDLVIGVGFDMASRTR